MNKILQAILKWIKSAYNTSKANDGLSANEVIESNRQDTIDLYKTFNIDIN